MLGLHFDVFLVEYVFVVGLLIEVVELLVGEVLLLELVDLVLGECAELLLGFAHLLEHEFVVLDLLELFCGHLGEVLVAGLDEVVVDLDLGEGRRKSTAYLVPALEDHVVEDLGLEVEVDGQLELLVRVDELLVEAEALDLGEVVGGILRLDLVGREA